MSHFKTVEWADLVRGVAAESDRTAMEAHLSAGCARCSRTVEILRNVVAAAATEAQYEAPEQLVLQALAMFKG